MSGIIVVIVVDKPKAFERLVRFIEKLAKALAKPERKPIKARKVCDAYAEIGLAAIGEDDYATASLACKLSERWYVASKEKEYW